MISPFIGIDSTVVQENYERDDSGNTTFFQQITTRVRSPTQCKEKRCAAYKKGRCRMK